MAAMPLYNPTHHMAAATSPGAAAAATGSLVNMQMNMGKDSRWLTLEVCREFQRSRCTRSDLDCKFAHPPSHVEIQNGRVTCCFDSIKGKCTRKEPPCKYLHPPQHLKEQLLQNGRTNLLMRQQLSMYPSAPIPLGPAIPQLQAYNPFGPTAAPAGYPYTGAAAVMPSLTAAGMMSAGYPASVAVSAGAMPSVSGGGGAGEGLVPLATTSTAVSSPSPASGASGIVSAAPKRADRLEVCGEYLKGTCTSPPGDCLQAHPADYVLTEEGKVIVCMDFVKGKCSRETCKYYHPTPILLQQVNQLRAASSSQNASAAAGASSAFNSAAAAAMQAAMAGHLVAQPTSVMVW